MIYLKYTYMFMIRKKPSGKNDHKLSSYYCQDRILQKWWGGDECNRKYEALVEGRLMFPVVIDHFLGEDVLESVLPLVILALLLFRLQKMMERVFHFLSLVGNEPCSIVFDKGPKMLL